MKTNPRICLAIILLHKGVPRDLRRVILLFTRVPINVVRYLIPVSMRQERLTLACALKRKYMVPRDLQRYICQLAQRYVTEELPMPSYWPEHELQKYQCADGEFHLRFRVTNGTVTQFVGMTPHDNIYSFRFYCKCVRLGTIRIGTKYAITNSSFDRVGLVFHNIKSDNESLDGVTITIYVVGHNSHYMHVQTNINSQYRSIAFVG